MTSFRRILVALALWATIYSGAAAQSLLDRLEQRLGQGAEAAPASDAPGYLGLEVEDAEQDRGAGLAVAVVDEGGPAEQAGLQPGDRILRINERPVTRIEDMVQLFEQLRAGDQVDFEIDRQGQTRMLTVTLGQAAAEPAPAVGELPPPPRLNGPAGVDPQAARPKLGVTVLEVTPELRTRYGLPVTRGAFVQTVRPGSPADRAGIPVGAAIVAIGDHRIEGPDDLLARLRDVPPDLPFDVTYYVGDGLRLAVVRLDGGPVGPRPLARDQGAVADDPARQPGRARRPILNRLGQVVDQIVTEDMSGGDTTGGEFAAMRAQIEQLQRRIEQLEQRLEQLEQLEQDRP